MGPKVKAEEVVAKKKESEKKTPTASAEIKDAKPTISSSSTVTEVKSITKEAKEEKKEKPTTIQTEAKPQIPCDKESVWLNKWKFDDAEARFYEKESCKQRGGENVERESSSTEVGNKKTENKSVDARRKGRVVKEITEEMENKELKAKLTSIEAENKDMRKSLAQLSEHIRALTARVNLLEKESSDEGVDVSFPSPTGSAPFCPHYTDCTCLTSRSHPIL